MGCRRSRSECGRLWAAPLSGWTHCLNGIGAEDDGAGVTDPSAVVAVNQTRTPLGVGPVMSRRPVGARLLASSLSDQVDAVGRSRINASGGRGCFGRAARDEPPCAPMKGLPRESRSDSARPVRIPERDLASSSLAGIDMEDIVVGTTGRRFSHPGQLPDWSIGGHNASRTAAAAPLSITVTTTAAPAVAQVGRCDVIASVVAGKVGGGSFVGILATLGTWIVGAAMVASSPFMATPDAPLPRAGSTRLGDSGVAAAVLLGCCVPSKPPCANASWNSVGNSYPWPLSSQFVSASFARRFDHCLPRDYRSSVGSKSPSRSLNIRECVPLYDIVNAR